MPLIQPTELPDPSTDDPLGFGLQSIAEPLQSWWLIGQGNPYFDGDVRVAGTNSALVTAFMKARNDRGNTAQVIEEEVEILLLRHIIPGQRPEGEKP